MMFGPRLNTVFASRWKALAWSASILVTAYCTVPKASDGNGGADDQQAMQMAKAMLPDAQPSAPPSKSPWAPDQPAPAH